MRTLTEKYLGGMELNEDVYKVDLAVLDRYQSFSSELLRLSLLGIAGYGFLVTNTVFKSSGASANLAPSTPPYVLLYLLPLGAAMLGLSAAAALGHRYFSTDCITHYVRRLRLLKRRGNLWGGPEAESTAATICAEEESLEKDLRLCKWLLLAASVFLTVGAASVAWAFAATIFAQR